MIKKPTLSQLSMALLTSTLGFASLSAQAQSCTANGYQEVDGKVIMEAENIGAGGAWAKQQSAGGFSGSGYLNWTGADSFNKPGSGLVTVKIKINSPGEYLLKWRTKVGQGSDATEHNDTWVKFPDAASFYGKKGGSVIYPKGSGKSPNPEGASADGYFKVYSSGTTDWTWSTNTSDNDAHAIYARFDKAGAYTMLVSARSKSHLMDRITLSRSGDATSLGLAETKDCGGGGGGGGGGGNPGTPPTGPRPAGFETCSAEDQRCSFNGTASVVYGAGNVWTLPRTFTNGVDCGNSVFGDPVFGTVKSCLVKAESSNPAPGGLAVSSFTVVDADSDRDLSTFTNSGTVSLSTAKRINVRANAGSAASVVFTEGGATSAENAAPFSFKGDKNGDYYAWSPKPGTYTITAKPFDKAGKAGTPATLQLTVVADGSGGGGGGGNPPGVTYQYELMLGHDGHADPDDNMALLAGYVAAKRAQDQRGSRVKVVAMIYGDTTERFQTGMQKPSSDLDRKAQANYNFFKKFGKPALQSLGFNTFFDVVPDEYNFNAKSLSQMSSGGAQLAERVRDAIGSTMRVVYSAGGGVNAAAEAIGWLRNQGYSDVQIKNHFAIVQHSAVNWNRYSEGKARDLAEPFTIAIEDQNPYSGKGKPPAKVSALRTSEAFANAWLVGLGSKPSGIPNLEHVRDASDGGSHHFASNTPKLEANWGKRGSPNDGKRVSYKEYNTAVMNDQLN